MKRVIRGRVYSDKGDKTIIVRVVMRQTHPVYKKQYTRHRKFMAHDEKNEARVGDLVSIQESKPISARKRFILSRVIERADAGYKESDAAADVHMEEIGREEKPLVTPKKIPKISSKNAAKDKPRITK